MDDVADSSLGGATPAEPDLGDIPEDDLQVVAAAIAMDRARATPPGAAEPGAQRPALTNLLARRFFDGPARGPRIGKPGLVGERATPLANQGDGAVVLPDEGHRLARPHVRQEGARGDGRPCTAILDQVLLQPRSGEEEPVHRVSTFRLRPHHAQGMNALAWVQKSLVLSAFNNQQVRRTRTEYVDNGAEARKEMQNGCFVQKVFGVLPVPVMHPEAKLRLAWMWAGLVFIVYEVVVTPYYTAFDMTPEGFFQALSQVVNGYFILDVIANFMTGYRDGDGTLIMAPSKMCLRYLRSWFLLDVFAAVPWEWLGYERAGRVRTLFKVFRLMRLMRLLRLLRMELLTDKLVMYMESNQVSMFGASILRVIFLLFTVTHVAACIWYSLGMYAEEDVTWVKTNLGFLEDDEKGSRYIWSMYFALTTMTTVGFGDIVAVNTKEAMFVLVLLLCASLVFAGLSGTLTDLITRLNSTSHARSEQKAMLSRYTRWRAVPLKLTADIRAHFLFLWETNENFDTYEEWVKSKLPPSLRAELCYHIYGQVLRATPFLGWMNGQSACIKRLSTSVHSVFLENGDFVFHMGQRIEQVSVLVTGKVWLSQNERYIRNEPSEEAAAYMIPRRKEGGLVDVGMGVVESAFVVVNRGKPKHAKRRVTEYGASEDFDEDMDDVEAWSKVLERATGQLRRRDAQLGEAARVVQRCWYRHLVTKQFVKRPAHTDGVGVNGSPTETYLPGLRQRKSTGRVLWNTHHIKSRNLKAPAFFGESALWVPLSQWATTPQMHYLYTVQCRSRVELVQIPLSAIKDTIEAFSPWLGQRLTRFQDIVHAGVASLQVVAVKQQDNS